MSGGAVIERALRHDRVIVGAGLAVVVGLAWTYTLSASHVLTAGTESGGMGAMVMAPHPWSTVHAIMIALMWVIMMVAMMVPSAAPTILLFATFHRQRRQFSRPHVATSVFVAGYLAIWGMFGVAAALLQWALDAFGLLSPSMASTSTALAAGMLIAAGLYQLTPLKNSCLGRCRTPLQFLSSRWRPGSGGAFVMGMEHGALCVGCCWLLMGLLFVGGIMNPVWIGGIAAYVFVEKVAAPGIAISRVCGLLLITSGLAILFASSA